MGYIGNLGRAVIGMPVISRELQASIAGGDGRVGPPASLGQGDNWFFRALRGGPTSSGVPVNEFNAMTLPAVYAAVRIVAGSIAQLPLGMFRKTEDGFNPVTDHPFAWKLANRPNPFMSSFTYRNTTQHHSCLWGNGYSEIERNGRGQAVGLWPLLPDRTRPALIDGSLVIRSTINARTVELDPEEVLHVKAIGFDGYVGMSPIAQAREAISAGLAMEKFGGKFFANDATSGGFLMHPGKLGSNAFANLNGTAPRTGPAEPSNPAARLERQGGLDNAHRVKVLEEGMKFVATTMPLEDAQFLASRAFTVEEISRIFGVPLVLLSSHEKTTSWGSGVEQLLLAFVTFVLAEWIIQWQQEMNYKLFTEEEQAQGYCVLHDVRALSHGDMTARANYYQSGISNKWLMPNECRVFEGLNKIPGGDAVVAAPIQDKPPVQGEGLRE